MPPLSRDRKTAFEYSGIVFFSKRKSTYISSLTIGSTRACFRSTEVLAHLCEKSLQPNLIKRLLDIKTPTI